MAPDARGAGYFVRAHRASLLGSVDFGPAGSGVAPVTPSLPRKPAVSGFMRPRHLSARRISKMAQSEAEVIVRRRGEPPREQLEISSSLDPPIQIRLNEPSDEINPPSRNRGVDARKQVRIREGHGMPHNRISKSRSRADGPLSADVVEDSANDRGVPLERTLPVASFGV